MVQGCEFGDELAVAAKSLHSWLFSQTVLNAPRTCDEPVILFNAT